MYFDLDSVFLELAYREALSFYGATTPNPPVGACVVQDDKVIAVAAHQRSGGPHAEVLALELAEKTLGSGLRNATLYVTLEPCNHRGKTPPCTQRILTSGVKKVIYGVRDPNPNVAGKGTEALCQNGIETKQTQSLEAQKLCLELILPFQKWQKTKSPWVLHKIALRKLSNGEITMLPDPGKKTFTNADSLKRAHLERKKSGAILTTVKTLLADQPQLTVRAVPDFPGVKRHLALLSRSPASIPAQILDPLLAHFHVSQYTSFETALESLGSQGVQRVLVEAGPEFSNWLSSTALWDEKLIFLHSSSKEEDLVVQEYRCSLESFLDAEKSPK